MGYLFPIFLGFWISFSILTQFLKAKHNQWPEEEHSLTALKVSQCKEKIDNTGFRLQVKENQTQREHKNDTIGPTVILLMEYV